VTIEHDEGRLQKHVRLYTMYELQELLRETNFNLVKSFYYQTPSKKIKKSFFVSLLWPIYSLLVKMKPSLSDYLVIVGMKHAKNPDNLGHEA